MTWKKTALFVAIFVLVLGGPFFLISTPMMDVYQGWIDQEPQTDFHKGLQLWMGGICYKTMRSDQSVNMYRKYLEYYPTSEDRPFAMLRYAQSLDDEDRNAEAIEAYEQLINEYPTHEYAQDAQEGIRSIKYVKAGTK